MTTTESRRLTAEFLGTAVLLAAIVGSGITASTGGSAAAQLFQHAVVVGAALAVLIVVLGPVSGAHFNPAVTVSAWLCGHLSAGRAARYVGVQVVGALTGTVVTHLTFGLPAASMAGTQRTGVGLMGAEALATGGLVVVILALVRTARSSAVAAAVGAWIAAAIYCTSSTAFANPVVTVARMFTDTYTGIAPSSAPGFLAGQALGAAAAVVLVRWMFPPETPTVASSIRTTAPPRALRPAEWGTGSAGEEVAP